MIWLILGDYRSGKTLRLVIEACSDEYKEIEIWGNFDLTLPNYRKIEITDLMGDISNKLILLDEMQNWFNSHKTFSIENEFFTDLIHDCDKENVNLFATSHRFMSVEVDFRNACHRIIKCERTGKEGNIGERLLDTRDFRFHTFSMYSGLIVDKKKLPYHKAKHYFELYDTGERVKRLDDKNIKLQLLLHHNPKEGQRILEELARQIKPLFDNGRKLTYASLSNELANLGYNDSFVRRIYAIIRE